MIRAEGRVRMIYTKAEDAIDEEKKWDLIKRELEIKNLFNKVTAKTRRVRGRVSQLGGRKKGTAETILAGGEKDKAVGEGERVDASKDCDVSEDGTEKLYRESIRRLYESMQESDIINES